MDIDQVGEDDSGTANSQLAGWAGKNPQENLGVRRKHLDFETVQAWAPGKKALQLILQRLQLKRMV